MISLKTRPRAGCYSGNWPTPSGSARRRSPTTSTRWTPAAPDHPAAGPRETAGCLSSGSRRGPADARAAFAFQLTRLGGFGEDKLAEFERVLDRLRGGVSWPRRAGGLPGQGCRRGLPEAPRGPVTLARRVTSWPWRSPWPRRARVHCAARTRCATARRAPRRAPRPARDERRTGRRCAGRGRATRP